MASETDVARLARELCEHYWRPIDTAPRDGKLVLLWCEDQKSPVVAHWSRWVDWNAENGWETPQGVPIQNPTHWMPLPVLPTQEDANG